MSPPAEEVGGILSWSRIRAGAAGFVLLTVAGLGALFVFGPHRGLEPMLRELRAGFVVLALASALLDVVLSAVRYQVFIRRIRPGTRLWLPVRADLAGRFLGAVTPSQSGGGPAQVFILLRGGVPVAGSLAFLGINLLCTLLFFLVAGGCAAWTFRARFCEGAVHHLIQYGFVASLAGFLCLLMAVLRPDLVVGPLRRLADRPDRPGRRPTAVARTARLLVASLDQYQAACRLFLAESPWLPVASLVLTILIYTNKFGLAWLVMRGLGAQPDLVTTLSLQALLHVSVFVAPSPGSSGIAEIATGAFMSTLLPSHLLGPFTLIYRSLAVYLPAAAGAVVLLAELRPGRPTAAVRVNAPAARGDLADASLGPVPPALRALFPER